MSRARLEEELKERLHTKKMERDDKVMLSNGYCYTMDNEKKIFVKANVTIHASTMFEGEFESLNRILATRTIRAPKPLLVIHNYDDTEASAIAMEFLDIGRLTNESSQDLGQTLAHLHDYNNKLLKYNKCAAKWIGGVSPSVKAIKQAKEAIQNQEEGEIESECIQFSKHSMRVGGTNLPEFSKQGGQYADRFVPEPNTEEIIRFGFNLPTSCGTIPQINEWTDDWVAFYARHRLDKAIRSLLSDHGDRELAREWSHLQLKIDKFFSDFDTKQGDNIVPALLHGDLWSGNVAQLMSEEGSKAVIYDPSSFYGHAEYDFGIARMFGCLPKQFERSYFEIMPKKKLFEKRNKLYQLFHHLNHWDHFGSGYRSSSLCLIKELNGLV